MNTNNLEADSRVRIDAQLQQKGWEAAQVSREGASYEDQKKALAGKRPDYVLYVSDDSRRSPLAVLEAKKRSKKSSSLASALDQATGYARKLRCPIALASDGVLFRSRHLLDGNALQVNGEDIREIPSEKILSNFVNTSRWDRGEVVRSADQLVSIFRAAFKSLRKDGLENIDAFSEFSQILFIKILSEIREDESGKRIPFHWNEMEDLTGKRLLRSYRSGLRILSREYEGVFGETQIEKAETLEKIIARLNRYSFIDVDADVKGEAYEYFLRRYNRQKSELAQYFTPRHIVRTMVELTDPSLGQKVYDPFCGTGGMLIQAFKHISKNTKICNDRTEERKRQKLLKERTIYGGDISRVVQAAKMNMILAGDGHSNIRRGSSLDVDTKGKHDAVITNIPFMDDEILCFRHCMDAVKNKLRGRICIIVPERFLDDARSDYVDLREELLHEWEIKRVVSLPREVFRGITSAKTSIIFAEYRGGDISKSKKVSIPYFKVENDGFTLDKRRDPLMGENDLDRLIEDRFEGRVCEDHITESPHWTMKPKEEAGILTDFPVQPLGDLVEIQTRPIKITSGMICREPGIKSKTHSIYLREEKQGYNVRVTKRQKILPGDLVFSTLHTQDGHFAFSDAEYHSTGTHLICRVKLSKIHPDYLFWALDQIIPTLSMVDTTGRENYNKETILALKIPCPPMEEQKEMVQDILRAKKTISRGYESLEKSREDFQARLMGKNRGGGGG